MFNRTAAAVQRASGNTQIPAIYLQFFDAAYLGNSSTVPVLMPPEAPRNLRAGTPGTDRVTLTWDSAGSGLTYQVYYNTQNNPADAKSLGNPLTGTSLNISSLTSGTNYHFWVSTLKDGQESGKSPVVTVLTAAAVPVNPAPASDMVRIQGGTFTMGSQAERIVKGRSIG
jgi:hypothetical protein